MTRPAVSGALAALGLLLFLLVLPASLPASAGGGGEASGEGAWQKIAWDMGIKFINFAVVVFILVRFLAKPLASYLSARAEAISRSIEELKAKGRAQEEAIALYDQRMKSMDEEIRKVREEARMEMEHEREAIMEEAQRAARDLVNHTRETARQEFAKARADLYRETATLSLKLAEDLIVKTISEKDQRRFAEEYIKKVTKEP